MLKKNLIKVIILSSFCLSGKSCFAQDAFSPLQIQNTPETSQAKTEPAVQEPQNDVYFTIAVDKFAQCNVNSSWENFKNFINGIEQNDFRYMLIADKMAELGLFDLSNLALSKIQDNDIAGLSMDEMKRFYYPRRKINSNDEMSLAESYSNIVYNNQSSEAVNELLRQDFLLSNYDYTNYLVALGSYKSGIIPQAKKYINLALIQNPTNLNYQSLKAKILAKDGDRDEALKTVENLKKQDLYSLEYQNKVKSLEHFVLYETSKKEWLKNYNLGYYYYIENENSKALMALQEALLSKNKPNKGKIYDLMSEIYLKTNEFEKAAETAKKAHRINSRNAVLTLGDLSYRDKNYKQALKYYKEAAHHEKKSYVPLVREAQTYQQLGKVKKAHEIYTKVLKTHFDSWEAYYNIALLDKDKETIYLKKALAVNPQSEDAWVELARVQIEKGNYTNAGKYLANVLYIDENNFKYYYYQGLLNKKLQNYTQAQGDFKKCLQLNPGYKDAQIEMEGLPAKQEIQLKQDSI